MNEKIKIRRTGKGGEVHSPTFGNSTVDIYSRAKTVKKTGKISKKEKRYNYTIFEVADFSHGFRSMRSFTNLEKAVAEAGTIARRLSSGEVSAAQMDSQEAGTYGRALEPLRAADIDTPLEIVASHYADAVKILGTDKVVEAAQDFIRRNPTERPSRTVADVATELVELKKNRKASGRHTEDLKNRLAKLSEKFSVNVDTVTTADVQAWFDGRDAAPRTVRNFRNAASALFKFAEARGYIARRENPVTATEQIKTKNADAIEIYSPKEISRLLSATPNRFKPVIAL